MPDRHIPDVMFPHIIGGGEVLQTSHLVLISQPNHSWHQSAVCICVMVFEAITQEKLTCQSEADFHQCWLLQRGQTRCICFSRASSSQVRFSIRINTEAHDELTLMMTLVGSQGQWPAHRLSYQHQSENPRACHPGLVCAADSACGKNMDSKRSLHWLVMILRCWVTTKIRTFEQYSWQKLLQPCYTLKDVAICADTRCL